MTVNDAAGELSEASSQDKFPAQLSPRTVRFSDIEWKKIEQAARAINISSATFARDAALSAAADRQAASSGVLRPELPELIKRIYRSTYMLSTPERDEMIRNGRARDGQGDPRGPQRTGGRHSFPVFALRST